MKYSVIMDDNCDALMKPAESLKSHFGTTAADTVKNRLEPDRSAADDMTGSMARRFP